MSRFVQRTGAGDIIGSYAKLQPGYAEEEIPDDHPDLTAFEAGISAPPSRDLAAELDALKAILVKKAVLTADEGLSISGVYTTA